MQFLNVRLSYCRTGLDYHFHLGFTIQFSSVAHSCPTLCDPTNSSTSGLPVHHQLPEFTQTHVHRVSDANPAISSSVIPFSSCPQSLPASESFPMSQLFAWGGQSTGVSSLASFHIEEDKYHMISLIQRILKNELIDTKKRLAIDRDGELMGGWNGWKGVKWF